MDLYGIIQRELNTCVDDIKRRHVQAGQRATGKTMNALEVRMRQESGRIIGEIWGMPYTGAWETGSRPASRRGDEMARRMFVQNLKEWMEIRGLTNGLTDKQKDTAAEHLAWYIKHYVSALWRKGGRRDIITPAIEATTKSLEQYFELYFEQLLTGQMTDNFFGSNTQRTFNSAQL